MSILIVGAGAAGGYLGAQLLAAGRDVTFLVHPSTLALLGSGGLRLRTGGEVRVLHPRAVTVGGLDGPYDVVIVAVRAEAVEAAINDIGDAVGPGTAIVPIMNGIRHLSLLTAAFGEQRVAGAATRLVASRLPDGMINVVSPGIQVEIGQLDDSGAAAVDRAATALHAPGISVTVRSDIVAAMWEKFALIASTAVLTCLVGDEIGAIARASGGVPLAGRVLKETASVAAAEGTPLADATRAGLDAFLTDPSSTFGPSMFRDMKAGRPIEGAVLGDLAGRARAHRLGTPLLDASRVVVDVHNRRIGAPRPVDIPG